MKIWRCAIFFCLPLSALASSPPASDPDPAFVRVSPRDPRYFELSDGRPYIPIGLNLIAPSASVDQEGVRQMEQWISALAENHGNFIRLWLSHRFFDAEHEKSGVYDEAIASRIDRVIRAASGKGVRVKMTIEHFRHFFRTEQKWAAKPLHHVSQGGPANDESDFFKGKASREQFKRKLDWYAGRYANDPTIFAWELWNEINAVRAEGWEDWTETMLSELRSRFPRTLVTQSLGSFDTVKVRPKYQWLALLQQNDFAQVHRYLDLGASLEVCHGPVDVLASDAVEELIRLNPGKPVVLAESGAVEPSHSGPFKLYPEDKAGIILHDILFAPFFSGAAAAGQVWHWDQYVAANNLWFQFDRFAQAVAGIDPPSEQFKPLKWTETGLRFYALQGKKTVLIWVRDSENSWTTELAEGKPPRIVEKAFFSLAPLTLPAGKVRVDSYDPWKNQRSEAQLSNGKVPLPAFSRSIVVRIR